MNKSSAGAILLAAGGSRRMRGPDKLLLPLAGRPLITYALRALEQTAEIEQVVVVLGEHNAEAILPLLRTFKKVTHTCRGGPRRQDSVRSGLYTLPAFDWIVVHDGARPFVTPALIRRGLEVAQRTGAAAAAVPVTDTLKAAQADGLVLRTVPREGLWAVQTPQVFRYDLLLMAHERVSEDVTDDCAMLERLGHPVLLYEGSRLNFKVTTPEDTWLAEAVARAQRRHVAPEGHGADTGP